jgi:quinol-cytochrome oxidoreductase complex cytochrome b subunit
MRFGSFLAHIHPRRLNADRIRFRSTLCLGGSAFFFFITLCATGVLLAFYYLPTASGARNGILDIDHAVPFGWLIRSVHYWSGQLMLISLILHTLRVIAAKAYIPPKRANWLIGIALFGLTLFLDFSGYILRWDTRGILAGNVMAHLLGIVPILGRELQNLILGGPDLGEASLLRIYVLHCLVCPGTSFALIAYHFWRIRIDGRELGSL